VLAGGISLVLKHKKISMLSSFYRPRPVEVLNFVKQHPEFEDSVYKMHSEFNRMKRFAALSMCSAFHYLYGFSYDAGIFLVL